VDDPFAIHTKLHQREGLMFVEATIANMTPRALYLEHVGLATSDPGLVVVNMNNRSINQNGGMAPAAPPPPFVATTLAPPPAIPGQPHTAIPGVANASLGLGGGGLFGEAKSTYSQVAPATASSALLSLLSDGLPQTRNASPSLFGSSDDREARYIISSML
jgi:hypothetical protein